MLPCRPTRPFYLLLAAFGAAPALAAPGDTLRLYGSLGVGHGDKLLRVPDGSPGFGNQPGDTWRQADAGLVFDHAYSRQRVSAQLKLSRVEFNHFRQLDYDDEDAQARWDWQLGHHLDGAVGARYNQSLAPYTDFASDQRNLRKQRRACFEGAWRFHPGYRVRAAASEDKFSYALAGQGVNDRTEDAWETAIALAACAALLFAGCGKAKDTKPGQALASVNGQEITVLQLNEELALAGVGADGQEVINLPSLVNDGVGHPRVSGMFALGRALAGIAMVWVGVSAAGIDSAARGHLAASLLFSLAFLGYVHGRTVPTAVRDLLWRGYSPIAGVAAIGLFAHLLGAALVLPMLFAHGMLFVIDKDDRSNAWQRVKGLLA